MRWTIFLLAMVWTICAAAQITCTVDTVDFGTIHETEGKKTLRAYVRNDGSTPAALLKVSPTCGCTAAKFQKEEFAPADSAWIELTYNPNRRPGRFEKAVKVYPVDGEMIRIPIKGTVFASPETVQQMFPVDAGMLHLSESTLMPARPLADERKSLYLDVYNAGEAAVYPLVVPDSEAVTVHLFPEVLPPGEKGMIGVYIEPRREPRTGKIEYTLNLYTASTPLTPEAPQGEPFPIKVLTER